MRTANEENSFVSRAEGKLEGAVRAFSYDFRNKTVLDIGSSTGGFTELALKLGAKKVIAVEKGTKQMKAPLRFDPRVKLHEKTDFFDTAKVQIAPDASSKRLFQDDCSSLGSSKNVLEIATHIDVILADVSFVSLTKILKHARQFADFQTDFLVMLKPQFEARQNQLTRGVVKNERMRREIIKNFENWLRNNGFFVVNKRDNDVIGKNGNQERFYYLKIAK